MKEYKMIQISKEHHAKLKSYCKINDKKLSKVVERLIDTHTLKLIVDTKNILKVG
jgi:hypothetical protein|tara:strand:- start:44 stop:208 length:165 start_codon:yes stop_codon:yes gene_type:complete